MAPRARLVIVDGRGAGTHRWRDALLALDPEIVARLENAGDLEAHDIVILDLPALDDDVLASIRPLVSATRARRVLTAAHEELPLLLRTGDDGLFEHIVPRTGTAANIHALVSMLRAPGRADDSATQAAEGEHGEVDWPAIVELLEWTVTEAVRVPGVVIRSYEPRANKLEIQLVFRLGPDFERFHCELPRRWRWPVRASAGDSFTAVGREHPTVQSFGEVERNQEIYVRELARGPSCAYLAILPWNEDRRTTVALGLWLDDVDDNDDDVDDDGTKAACARLVADLHARAVREVMQFALPTADETDDGVRYLLEYHWVVTRSYAGPDRRKEDTPLINRHMLGGRRKVLAQSVRKRAGGFVDGVPPWVRRYFAVYAFLAAIDTACTWRFIGVRHFVELNPVLAPLLAGHPWLFFMAKNVFALGAFGFIMRFHLFGRAIHFLRASVGAYALLDVYWAFLLARAFAH